jgi:alanine-synthesizing transaminase
MYVRARTPDRCRPPGSLGLPKHLLAEAKVSVSPGIGLGDYGDRHVRFALIEDENRIRQAVWGQNDVAALALRGDSGSVPGQSSMGP